MYAPQWIRTIQENSRIRRQVHDEYLAHCQVMRPLLNSLYHWNMVSASVLETTAAELRAHRTVMISIRGHYLMAVMKMGGLENFIYRVEVVKHHRLQKGSINALDEMLVSLGTLIEAIKDIDSEQ